jgi:hypothetical protein
MERILLRKSRFKLYVAIGCMAVSFVPWLFPSNVVDLIASHRDVLLGWYSFERLTNNLFLTVTLWLAAYVAWSLRTYTPKEVSFRIIALLLAIFLSTVTVDIVGRFLRRPRYIETQIANPTNWPVTLVDDIVRHRPPNQRYHVRYIDAPPTARSYPSPPPGYPPRDITLTIDHRGFRNLTHLEEYDIVIVGDSFTEGAYVSDDEPWPALLGQKLNRTVYNLGVGGGGPGHYLAAFQAVGLELKPKTAIFMVYEGNDFKAFTLANESAVPQAQRIADAIASLWDQWMATIKSSPVMLGLRSAFVRYLGPINAGAPVPGAEVLSWMPLAVPTGPDAKYYAFTPNLLLKLYVTNQAFRESSGWTSTAEVFRRIRQVCAREGIRLIFVYAPSKPHVIMPLVKDRITPEQLYTFASSKKSMLPPPQQFTRELFARLDVKETVLREFLQEEGVEFVDTTEILRQWAAEGRQVYYTYDNHWTALGHEAVAEALVRYLTQYPTRPLP